MHYHDKNPFLGSSGVRFGASDLTLDLDCFSIKDLIASTQVSLI